MADTKKPTTDSSNNHMDKSKWQREQYDLWDIPSFLILMLDALEVEIISDTGHLPIAAPIHVKCSFKNAKRISKSQHFNVELIDKDIWRISLNGFEYPFPEDSKIIRWEVENRKEAPTRRAENWFDMMIENNAYDRTKAKT